MSKVVLKTENLGISFGGLKAVQNLNQKLKKDSYMVWLALTVRVKLLYSI